MYEELLAKVPSLQVLGSKSKLRGMRVNLVARSKSVFFDSGHSVEKLIFVCSTLENR
jgi:hypothetical protein